MSLEAELVFKKYAKKYFPDLLDGRHKGINFKGQDVVKVYTDGACKANGREDSKGGIGIYWEDNHPLFAI